jgi:DeoR/GlpR family transcriptional regulator of sugar metabolism
MNRNVSRILTTERRALIAQIVAQQGAVRTTALVQRFNLSPTTARRDLIVLEKQGLLRRVHGGAIAVGKTTPATVMPESVSPAKPSPPESADPAEVRIGRAAANMVSDGQTVFLGAGRLPLAAAQQLIAHRSDLTIVTNGLDVAHWVATHKPASQTLILTGGQAEERGLGLLGQLVQSSLANLRPNHVILELGGISPVEGLTDDSLARAETAHLLFETGAQVILLAPPERVGRVAAAYVAAASELDVLITTREAPASILWDLSEADVQVVLV